MDLLNHCLSAYKDHRLDRTNGIPCTEHGVHSMLEGIRDVMMKNLRAPDGQPVNIPEISSLALTPNGAFNAGNLADVLALIFETVVEDNGDPRLWQIPGDDGWRGAVNHAFIVYYRGPYGEALPDPANGVKAATFSSAKATMKKYLHQSHNLFQF